MEPAQPVVLRADLAVLADRSPEVVVLHRQVVPVGDGGGLLLHERRQPALGVGAAVVHVVAGGGAAGAEFHERGGLDVERVDADTPVVGADHAAADFAGEVGIPRDLRSIAGFAATEGLVGDVGVGAQCGEMETGPVVAGHGGELAVPETFGVNAVQRQNLAEGQGCLQLGPAGTGVERRIEAGIAGDPFQREQVLGGAAVFVFQLDADDGAAVLPEQAAELGGDLLIERGGAGEVGGIVGTDLAAGDDPVGQAAVADFAVAPRSAAHDDAQTDVAGRLDEAAQLARAGPVPLAFDLLVVNPENVGGDDVDAAGLHLEQFVAPLGGGGAGVVEFSHHRRPRLAVEEQAAAVGRDGGAGRVARGAHGEPDLLRSGWGEGDGERVGRLGYWRRLGDGFGEVRGAVGAPGDRLHAGVAVGVAKRVADDVAVVAGVIDQEVGPAVVGGGEAVVAGAEDAGGLVGGEDRRGRLVPRFRIEEVGVGICGE